MNYLDKLLRKAEKEHDLLKHPYVGTEHLLLALLSEDNDLTEQLSISNLSYNKFKRKIKEIIGESNGLSDIINNSLLINTLFLLRGGGRIML